MTVLLLLQQLSCPDALRQQNLPPSLHCRTSRPPLQSLVSASKGHLSAWDVDSGVKLTIGQKCGHASALPAECVYPLEYMKALTDQPTV